MGLKEKLLLFLLFLLFLATGAMFYYQNFYLEKSNMEGKEYVVVAKTDIAKGDVLHEGENYSYLPMDKQFIPESYITVDKKGEYKQLIEGKAVNSPILQYEIITKERIETDSKQEKEQLFRLFIAPTNKIDVEKGDRINIYVKTKYKDPNDSKIMHYETYKLMEDVIVQDAIKKKDSKGNELPEIQHIELHVSELDAVYFEMARQMTERKAEIVVLEYKDVLKENDSKIPFFKDSELFEYAKQAHPDAVHKIQTAEKAN